jgi:hypothetical protein
LKQNLWICSAFWWLDMNIYLLFFLCTSIPIFLPATNRALHLCFLAN